MNKRLLAYILTAAMVLSEPLSAFALETPDPDGEITIDEEENGDGNIDGIPQTDDPDESDLELQLTDSDDSFVLSSEDELYVEELPDVEDDIEPDSDVSPISDGRDIPPEVKELWDRMEAHPGYIHVDDVPEIDDIDMSAETGYQSGYHTMGTGGTSSEKYLLGKYTTPVLPSLRNQDPYGTCWAHGSMALAEISLINQGYAEEDINLSELQLAYFMYNRVLDPLGGTEGDIVTDNVPYAELWDIGGRYDNASYVLATWTGAVDETTVPYSSAETVLEDGLGDEYAYSLDSVHLTDIYRAKIADFDENSPEEVDNQLAVKKLIVEHGAVGISFYASSDYYNYWDNCFYSTKSNNYANHAVTVVGWDDNFSKKKFGKEPAGDGAWLVRNSWTTGYEEDFSGYFWMSYYEKSLDPEAIAFSFKPVSESYDNNYQYDGAVADGEGCYQATAANIFTAHAYGGERGELVKAVSFATNDANVDYTVEIYKDLTNDKDPESGMLVATVSGSTVYPGYHTVELDPESQFRIMPGHKFSVVVTFAEESEDNQPSVSYEKGMSLWTGHETIYMGKSAQTGQSFVKGRTGWDDCGLYNTGNLRIKAFTDNCEVDMTAEPSGLSFEEAEVSIGSEMTIFRLPTILPETANRAWLSWSSDTPAVATVSDRGYVTGISTGDAVITATSANGKSASYTVHVSNVIRSMSICKDKEHYKYSTNCQLKLSDEGYQFRVTTVPSSPDGKVEWSSTDSAVLEIDADTGVVTPRTVGYCNVIATWRDQSGVKKTAYQYVSVDMESPQVTARNDGHNNIVISWSAVPGASKYLLEAYNTPDGNIELQTFDSGEDVYTYIDSSHSSETEAKQYQYMVTAYDKNPTRPSRTYAYASAWVGTVRRITYVLNGATNPDTNPDCYVEGSWANLAAPVMPLPKYRASYWCSDAELKIRKSDINSADRGDMVLYAKNEPYQYIIYYYLKDEYNSSRYGGTYSYYEDVTIQSASRTGFSLVGWNTREDYTGITYSPGQVVKSLADTDYKVISLYAMWGYDVNLDPNGGTCSISKIAVSAGNAYGAANPLPGTDDVTRPGYVFDGWYTLAEGGMRVTDETIVTQGTTHTLYAHWKPITYDIAFDGNGIDPVTGESDVSGTMESMTGLVYGNDYALTANTFTRSGYGFKEWNLKADGTGTVYADGATVSDLATINNETVTMYAQWEPAVYHIAFNPNADDARGSMDDIDAVYGQWTELPANRFARIGYKFSYWSMSPDYIQNDPGACENRDRIISLTDEDDATVTLYAHWEQIKTSAPSATVTPSGTIENDVMIYDSGARVHLACDMPDAVITYSINGEAAKVYKDAIVIDQNNTEPYDSYRKAEIRFNAAKAGYEQSATITQTVLIRDESADWGDLDLPGYEEVKASITDPSKIPSGLWLYGIENKTYTGSAVTQPKLKVFYGKKALKEDADYIIKYSGNVKSGTASVTVTGKGNFAGSISRTFTIGQMSLADAETAGLLVVPDITCIYTGKVQKGITTVRYRMKNTDGTFKDVTLKAGTDFTYEYPDTTADAYKGLEKSEDTLNGCGYKEYTVRITGKGNFKDSVTFTERILAKNNQFIHVNKLKISAIPAQVLSNDNNGEIIPSTPGIVVKTSDGTELSEYDSENGTGDYTLTYYNNAIPGTGSVIITGKGTTYTGSRTLTFKINGIPMSKVTCTLTDRVRSYTGEEVDLPNGDYTLKYGETDLVKDRDFTVSYKNNINAGRNRAAVTFTGKGAYTGSVKKTFTITTAQIDLTDIEWADGIAFSEDEAHIPLIPYTKGAVKPGLVITHDGRTLTEGTDYTVRYKNNTTVNSYTDGDGDEKYEWSEPDERKRPTLTITGKGNYLTVNPISLNFAIMPASLEAPGITMTAADIKAANSAGCKTTVTINDTNGTRLAAGTDYDRDISYTYVFDTTVRHKISRNEYTEEVIPADAEVDPNNDILPAGCVIRATVTGKGNYTGSYKSATFTVIAANMDISKATVKVSDQVYTGKPIEISKEDIKVTLNKVSLDDSEDHPAYYRIVPGSFENNVNKGTARFIIEGRGGYGGRRTVTFKIVSRSADFTVTYDKNLAYMTEVFDGAHIDVLPVISGNDMTGKVADGKSLAHDTYKLNGFVFAGWNTEPDGSGVMYASGGKFDPTAEMLATGYGSNVRLYAQWMPVEYKLTYKLNGGINEQYNPATYTILDPVEFSDPVRDNYVFAGWFYDSRCTSKPALSIPIGTTGNKTLYAKWTVARNQ